MNNTSFRILAATAVLISSTQFAQAFVNYSIFAGRFTDQNGVNVTGGTLFQLVSLGANGIFDPINLADGSVTGFEQWVSGDDSVITASYIGDPQFTTMAAFDLQPGADNTGGILQRDFKFNLASGGKFGVRWFPGLQATTFDPNMAIGGQWYGEFTRQNDPTASGPLYDGSLNSGELWVYSDGADTILDNLRTVSAGGLDANSVGQASHFIPAPEPSSAALAAFGVAGMLGLRRRRS